MKTALAIIAPLALLAACATVPEAEDIEIEASAEDLIGNWDVSLFFSPDEAPSKTMMVVEAVDDGVLSGTFYGSPFFAARAIVNDDEVLFTAVTEDNSGRYIHSGELEDGEIEGTTFAVGRDFLMAWEAEPMEGEPQ
ncbi:MAG: hypothetical protein AAFO88_05675 [Pseudomonadota bacterium]